MQESPPKPRSCVECGAVIPEASRHGYCPVVLPLVLGAAGLPETTIAAAIPLLLSIDWLLARGRSGVSVMSDMLVAILLDRGAGSRPGLHESENSPVETAPGVLQA